MINVNIIKVWHGTRHERLRALWERWARLNAQSANLIWFDNMDGKLDHVPCYEAMWKEEVKRPERFAIFTEHDFIPGPCFFYPALMVHDSKPMVVAPYCTRDPDSTFHVHDRPGAWYILIDKEALRAPMYFKSGMFDTCNNLELPLKRYGQSLKMLSTRDCYPAHYGLDVLTPVAGGVVGTHLFWSRHYNDPPGRVVCGFALDEIRAKIDKVIKDAEAWHPATGACTPAIPTSNLEANREVRGDKCPPPDRSQQPDDTGC